MKKTLFIGLLSSMLVACTAEDAATDVVVSDAWARATVAGQPMAAAYFTIENPTDEAVKLVGVETAVAQRGSLHRSMVENGVATMRPLDGGLVLDPGETAIFEPGADHVMLEGLKQPLAEGTTVALTLSFEDGDTIEVPVDIVGAGER